MAPKTKAAASGSSATAVVTAPAIPKAANSAAAPLPASTAAPVLPKPRRATPQRTPPLVTAGADGMPAPPTPPGRELTAVRAATTPPPPP